MKTQWKKLLISVAPPLITGGIAALLTSDSMKLYDLMNKPAASPPAWIFPVVWTILYVLMGIASYLVLTSGKPVIFAESLYLLQLFFNFVWPLLFFNRQWYLLSWIWLVLLWVLVFLTLAAFRKISRCASLLLLPYLLWLTFAGYLNLAVYLLN